MNYEGGEAIGLFANDTQMAAYAIEKGLVGATSEWSALDEATKQATRMEYAQNMQALAGATGQASRESDGYENQLGNINQAWDDLLAIVGDPVFSSVVGIIKNITDGLQQAGDKVIFLQDGFNGLGDSSGLSGIDADLYEVGEKIRGISDGFVWAGEKVGEFINNTGGIQGVIDKVVVLAGAFAAVKTAMMIGGIISAVSTAFGVLTGIMSALSIANIVSAAETGILMAMYAGQAIAAGASAIATGVMTAAQWALNAALTANPIGIIIALIVAFIAGIVYLWNTNEGFRNAIIAIWESIKGAFATAVEGIQSAWGSIVGFFQGIWAGIVGAFQSAVTGIQTAWSVVVGFFQGVWDGIVDVFMAVVGFISGIYQAEWEMVVSFWSGAIGFFEGIVSGIQSAFASVSQFIIDAFNGAVKFLQELPQNAIKWAKDMMDGFVQGIKDGISAVGDAVKGVADKITSFLHFSRPDEGPLRQYETWMPDMMMGLASGITNNVGLVKEALSGMTGSMSAKVTGEVSGTPATSYGRVASTQTANNSAVGDFNFSPTITVNVGSGGTVKESLPSIEEQLNIFMTDYVEKMRLRNPQIFAY